MAINQTIGCANKHEKAHLDIIEFCFRIGKQFPNQVTNLFPDQVTFPDRETIAIFGNRVGLLT